VVASKTPQGPQNLTGIQAEYDETEEVASNLAKWAIAGRQGERKAVGALQKKGYVILATQLYVRTSSGLRITDFVVTGGPAGTDIAAFEVKVNDSPYTPLQQLKDSIIAGPQGGTVVSLAQPGFAYGTTVRYTTYLMTVQMI
jgi:hypothetical protein